MMQALRFEAAGGQVYLFPPQSEFNTNFADLLPSVVRLPGMNGGFDAGGSAPAVAAVGNVRVGFWLRASDMAGSVRAQLDALYALASWGVGWLIVDAGDGTQRAVQGRVNNVRAPMDARSRPDAQLRVVVDVQAANPFWVGAPVMLTQACSGPTTDFSVTVGGSAPTPVVLGVVSGGCGRVRVARRVGGVEVARVAYDAPLAAGDVLTVDVARLAVTRNGVAAYGAAFSALTPDWLTLLPGANALRVTLGAAADAATVTLDVVPRWW